MQSPAPTVETGAATTALAWMTSSAVMSTAEAVSVAHQVGVRGWFLRGEPGGAADIVECLAGTAAKDNPEDLARLRRYLERQAAHREGEQWKALHAARHLLPG